MTLNRINSLISIQTKQVALNFKIVTGINFYLTNNDLKTISQQKRFSKKLQLSPELLADLRYYILLQNRITFTTYYVEQQQKIAVIKSVISLQGKISQQICRRFLNNPQLLRNIVISHYWLSQQLCDLLQLKYNNKSSVLTLFLSLIIVLFFTPFFFYFFTLNWLVKLIILLIIFYVFYFTINFIIKKYLLLFLLSQLLFGFLSKDIKRKSLGFRLLRYFS